MIVMLFLLPLSAGAAAFFLRSDRIRRGLLIVTAILDKLLGTSPHWVYWLGMLLANILIALVSLSLVRRYGQTKRLAVGSPRPVAKPENAYNHVGD